MIFGSILKKDLNFLALNVAVKTVQSMIRSISCDMSSAFINGISSEFPDVKITFDKFHVMKMMNEAVDEVRKQEQSTIKKLKNSKYLWLKNEGNLSEKQKERFLALKNQKLKTVRAYNVKLSLQEFWGF